MIRKRNNIDDDFEDEPSSFGTDKGWAGAEQAERPPMFGAAGKVSFQWKNPDFLLRNPDSLIRNSDFLLKNVDFISKQGKVTAKGLGKARVGSFQSTALHRMRAIEQYRKQKGTDAGEDTVLFTFLCHFQGHFGAIRITFHFSRLIFGNVWGNRRGEGACAAERRRCCAETG